MQSESSFDLEAIIESQHVALDEFVRGNDQPLEDLYSRADDVTLGNPFGPYVRGFDAVAEAMSRAASYYRDGSAVGFDRAALYATPQLACLVETERYRSKVGGSDELTPVAVRVSSVFRLEGGGWKLVHRHADPITSAQPAQSVVQL